MSDWKLQKFEVEKKEDYKNSRTYYQGRVKFRNSDWEEFDLKLNEQTTAEIMKLILPDIAFATSQLTDQLWDHVDEQAKKILSNSK